MATFNLLQAMRKSKDAGTLIFASTNRICGEASVLPTSEDYGPLIPISTPGASKLGYEGLIAGCAHTFGFRVLILRLVNIVGLRSNHGVIFNFVRKLRGDQHRLEVLGNGRQRKSYMHIEDCVDAILRLTECFLEDNNCVEIYNIGSGDHMTVREIAEIVIEETRLENVKIVYTVGVEGGRGWLGI